jgi:hypothetical protein
MMQKISRIWLLLWLLPMHSAFSAGIQNLTFVEVVKDCIIINAATKAETPAKAGDVLTPPNVLKTGADSRAELIAEDKTVTRVGANTIFSVEADTRDVNIAQGSVLFASPKGRGGGRIKSAGATASVLGTTMIVGANQAGGMKVMLLEGKGEVKGLKGGGVTLNPGQLSFALPGKPPSAPMNFELKGQVNGSKLVKGFSKPLASIAKIEAAIAVQNLKISGGGLSSTGLLLGDRPQAAFPIFLTQAQLLKTIRDRIITKVIEKEEVPPETEIPDVDKTSKAFAAALKGKLNLTGGFAPVSSVNSSPTPDADTDADLIFIIDGSGRTSRGTVPTNIPGNRETGGVMATLVGNDISLKLSPVNATTPGAFLQSPFLENVDRNALLALNDISLMGSIEFTGYDKVTTLDDGASTGKSLILSAGHALVTAPGSLIRAATSLFEIYVAGTGYTADVKLEEKVAAAKEPLLLDRVSIVNQWPFEGDVPLGVTRITAPSVTLKNVAMLSGEIVIESKGAISATKAEVGRISTTQGVSTVTFANPDILDTLEAGQSIAAEGLPEGTTILSVDKKTKTVTLSKQATSSQASVPAYDLLPLGIDKPADLTFCAPKISFTSSGSSIALNDVFFYTDDGLFSAAEGLTIGGVTVASMDFQKDQKFTAIAGGDLNVSESQLPAAVTSEWTSLKGKVSFSNLLFGTAATDIDTLLDSTDPKTSFKSSSAGDMSIKDSEISADKIDLASGQNLKVSGGKFSQTDSLKGWFKASAEKSVSVENFSTISALTTSILAGVDILLKQSVIQAPQSNLPESIFWAQATTGSISIQYGVVDASNVTLTAAGDITIEGVSINGALNKSVFSSRAVNFVSNGGDIVISDAQFGLRQKKFEDENSPSSLSVNMWAANKIQLERVDLSSAQATTLDAFTVVLKDLSFKDGSSVNLNSSEGLVASRPGTSSDPNSAVRGQVNFLTGVKYGNTVIALPDQTSPMNNNQFKGAVNSTLGISRDAFTIGTHAPKPPTLPAKP